MATISVMILTYNHAPFIAQALNSVLMQNTTHKVEIIIIEDCSTDGTQDIVREYAKKYPDKITAYLHPENIGRRRGLKYIGRQRGIQSVVYEGLTKLGGDYIALLEGDDYWTSPDKLQKQITFLEANPEFVACAHNTIKIYEDGSKQPHRFMYWENIKSIHKIDDFVALTSFFHLTTVVFRNMRKLTGGPAFKYIQNSWCCDIYFNMVHVQYGKLHYVNEDMAVYRCHAGGNFSNMPELKGRLFNINGHRRFNYWLRYRYLKGFSFAIFRLCRGMLRTIAAGGLPPLSRIQRLKYTFLGGFYGKLYDLLDKHPGLDPAVFWFKEAPKPSRPRFDMIKGYDKCT